MERESRLHLGCALFTCLTIPLMLCVIAIVWWAVPSIGGLLAADSTKSSAPNAPARTPSAAVDRIVLIGDDGNLYVADRNGSAKIALTKDAALARTAIVRRAYLLPSWSPDSQTVAYVGLTSENDGKATLYATSPQAPQPRELFASDDAAPFYLSWSPDGAGIAFLIQRDDNELSLKYAKADGSGADELGVGNPFYFSWAPDSQSMIGHIGGSRRQAATASVSVISRANEPTQRLPIAPANFLAPAWSPDGKTIVTALMGTATTSDTLIISNARGESTRTLANLTGEVAFSWSPNAQHIAYMVTQRTRTESKSELRLVKSDGSDEQLLTSDNPLAFFWSPDGKYIAYLARARGDQGALQWVSDPAQQPLPRLAWKVITIADKTIVSLATFTPTERFAALIPYFDQYGQSLRLWSPDSTALVYAAQEASNNQGVYVATLNSNGEPRRIAAGSFGVWSWR
jgi:TolB protein